MALLEKLTLGDLADVEDVCGKPLSEVDTDKLPMKFALALYWVVKRRDDPKFTYEDARNVPLTDLDAFKAALQPNPTAPLPVPPEPQEDAGA